jgi:hypothetical protein
MKLALIKKDNSFYPYYNSDIEAMSKLHSNVVYMAEVKKPRHLEHHKKLFALANCTIANLPETSPLKLKIIDAYGLIKAIEIEVGLTEHEYCIDGGYHVKAKSIDFASMDQLEFQEFYDKAIYIMAGLIGVSVEELETNSIEFM